MKTNGARMGTGVAPCPYCFSACHEDGQFLPRRVGSAYFENGTTVVPNNIRDAVRVIAGAIDRKIWRGRQ